MGARDVSFEEWLRFVPFVIVALNLFGWALIEMVRTPWREWDKLTVSIILTGGPVLLYIGALAVTFSPLAVSVPRWFFDLTRGWMALSIIGTPVIYYHAYRAVRARLQDRKRRKVIYDLPDERRPS